MFPTAEVRWFWESDVPEAALAWLRDQTGEIPSEDTRTDHYLMIATTDALGIKLREGAIEVKQRNAPPHPEQLTERAHGLTERWIKWSFDLVREHPVLNQLLASRAWVGVKKTRRLKEYRITEGGLEPLRADPDSTQVCAVEITQVAVSNADSNTRWWTLGLEASGEESQLTRTLHLTATALLDAPFPAAMTVENSYSYPHWLRLLYTPK